MWWRIIRGNFRGLVPALLGLLAGWDLPLLRQIRAGGGGVGPLGQRQALFLFFFLLSLSFLPLFSLVLVRVLGTFGVSWGPCDHYWPRPLACLSFGSVGTGWVWWVGSVGLQFHIDRVVFGGPLWPAEFGGPVGPFSLLAWVSSLLVVLCPLWFLISVPMWSW